MKKQAADAVIEGADDAFGLAVSEKMYRDKRGVGQCRVFHSGCVRHGYRIPCRCQSERQEEED